MTRKALLTKIALYGVLPFVIISIAMAIFGREPVSKFLMYATPVLVLPLLLKILKAVHDKKKSDSQP